MRTSTLIALFVFLYSLGICQPDTNMAYVCQSRPLTAIRFGDGWYKTYTYEKMISPKIPRVPKEIIDSGTYSSGRWTITFKSKMSVPSIKIIKGSDIYGKPFDKKSKWRSAKRELYPTLDEFRFEEWKKANYEKFIEEKKEAIKKITESWIRKYCPNYLIIIDSSFCGPGCYYSVVNGKNIKWDGNIDNVRFPDVINTIVHESVHNYNKSSFGEDTGKAWRLQHLHRYMIEPGTDVTVDQGMYYQTSEFISIVPKDAPTRIFRYGTYVSASSSVSANVWGIYGMLDEFSAYYNGTKSSWDGYHTAKRMGLKEEQKIFWNSTWGTYFAWYEFRTFIGWYIQFAKMKHQDVYEDMMKNENLKKVFREIDSRYKKLVDELTAEGIVYDDVEYIIPLMAKIEPILDDFKKEAKKEAAKKSSPKKKKK